ncbi:SusC/RagA family TonB-linked outer membrane protein [Parafilimonas sp.]|uniref:SusC/RagA family TonB-linked outer membrane protein n=1 Tax=Parafilimonas sp. TaxID=1969739 RepID=UPI0039E62BF8
MKKVLMGNLSVARKAIPKFLLYMRLIAFFMLVTCLHVHAKGIAQTKITVSLKNAPIKQALLSIQKSSSYRFIYNDDILPHGITVTLTMKDADVRIVMDSVLSNTGLTYRILDNNLIVITPRQQKPQADPVKGNIKVQNKNGSLSAVSNVSVIEKGTSNGTRTDDNGDFSISVSSPNATLLISHVGYVSQEYPLNGQTTIAVVLHADEKELGEVVVTALGITRQKKSLTYATQSLKGEELSNSREVNITSAMNGKVAGLTINKTNSGPGGSNRIIFRGNRSIGRTNQPLVVVDGVRIDNSAKASADVALFGARDDGDGISNINPDDIESMTVLTGASAAALYGSDASNGAIIITTKKGRIGKGIGVQISSSASMETPLVLPDFQNKYGQGDAGVFVPASANSWGPAMTGQDVTDWTGKTQALTPQPNNVKDFFRTGTEFINSAAISAGTEKEQTYFSYTNTLSNGILPNNSYKRNNVLLRQTTQIATGLSLDVKANYIAEDVNNRPLTGAGNRITSTLYAMPRSLRLSDIKDFETFNDDGTLTQNYWGAATTAFQNPYWSAYRNLYTRKRDRFIGMAALRYQLTPELSIQARTSLDYYTDIGEEKDYDDTYWLTDYPGQGNYVLNKESNRQFNNDVLLSYTKNLTDEFSLTANAGASIEQYHFERTTLNNQGLNAPNIFATSNAVSLTNSVNNYIPYSPLARTEKQSVYVSAQLAYNDYLFLDLTGRNDWNSTLPVKNASYFFPSAGLSALLNEMVKLPAAISALKLRTSYAFVGNGTGFNELKPVYTLTAGGNGGFLLIDRTLRNASLKPEETHSFEAGLDAGFIDDRFGFQATYYNTNTINQILTVPVPAASGYSTRIINAGKIQNQGIELLINAQPVKLKGFSWKMQLVFGSNVNKVIRLDSLQPEVSLSSPQALGSIVVKEGRKYGELYTSSLQRDDDGNIVVDATGSPLLVTDQTKYAGNFNPDWTAGFSNTFQYKNWSLYFLIDERKGGTIISGTQALMASAGTLKATEANRETGFVIPNSVTEDGSKNTQAITAQDYWMQVAGNNIGELFAYSATNIRLREASISYIFASAKLANTFIKGAQLSLIGRNLFFFKNKAKGIDPESALGTGNNQGIEYASLPSTRGFGLYLKFNF